MSGSSARQRRSLAFPRSLTTLLLLPLLAACLPADGTIPRQISVEWPEKRLAFIADERLGSVRAFRIGSGAPILVAQSTPRARTAVRDLALDAQRGELWVLGRDSVDVHVAETLAPRWRIPLEARDVARLRLGADGIELHAASGVLLGRIDRRTRVAVWRPAWQVRAG